MIQLPNLIKKQCSHCSNKELDVLAAIQITSVDLKQKKVIVTGKTVYKCLKCRNQTLIIRDKNECEFVAKYLDPKLNRCSEKALPKEESIIKKVIKKIEGKKDHAGT